MTHVVALALRLTELGRADLGWQGMWLFLAGPPAPNGQLGFGVPSEDLGSLRWTDYGLCQGPMTLDGLACI